MRGRLAYPRPARRGAQSNAAWAAAGTVKGVGRRLPSQYQDAETGLHYNLHRYYDPDRGQYLTPDPLGTPDGPNPYSYVRGNPLRYVDPEGLILFAFDGTNNSNPPPDKDTWSNVYKFYLAYDEKSNGEKWYMNGVGRDDKEGKIIAPKTTTKLPLPHVRVWTIC
ncbi:MULTISPECIES: RHS repeat-associated core domain-containing protein [Delftia]|jgi:RHS repeat-associated protein|uniref:RHS repeat-associated core domain-containing protein n=1 Tax=Delftia TaxID=80865 RepID=UPI000F81D319|nr:MULTISPECIES: RHS repeat-associated core domain-containing protein [Delftia]MDH0846803.1 RHS repeat-associated core domain-containing protein [Delftia tsuruhatensis]WEL97313.1 RHS repeat-associated core domain-containing protein [Delftia tsuruhatensis]WQM84550.1 RHS repeat-associated core domain-containing protein [Delftia tsuruhatensis]